jgi:hypothetical protein
MTNDRSGEINYGRDITKKENKETEYETHRQDRPTSFLNSFFKVIL